MNFFHDAHLIKSGDSYEVDIFGHKTPLTAEQNKKLREAAVESQDVIAGVRPVHIIPGSGIQAKVDVSEMMGSELHLHLDVQGTDVVAIVPVTEDSMTVANGSDIQFSFDPKNLQLFHKETEKSLLV